MSIDDGTVDSVELLRLHARAQELVDGALVGSVDWESSTPCEGWNLGKLLAHMLGQNLGLRAARQGGGQDIADWRPAELGSDPAEALAASERSLVAAFAAAGLTGVVWMPELAPTSPIPARIALLAHLVDTVVHGWDIAASRGRPYDVPADVLTVVESATLRIPAERAAGSAFRAPVTYQGVSRLESVLTYLGRDPRAWSVRPVG